MSPNQLFISGLENLSEYSAETGFQFTELIQVLNTLFFLSQLHNLHEFFSFSAKGLNASRA
jgi:hypothetical protein